MSVPPGGGAQLPEEPQQQPSASTKSQKATRRKPSRQGVLAEDITQEDLAQWFHLPSEQAAAKLGISLTVLKRVCRRFGIKRWPFRKVKSLERLIGNLSSALPVAAAAAGLPSSSGVSLPSLSCSSFSTGSMPAGASGDRHSTLSVSVSPGSARQQSPGAGAAAGPGGSRALSGGGAAAALRGRHLLRQSSINTPSSTAAAAAAVPSPPATASSLDTGGIDALCAAVGIGQQGGPGQQEAHSLPGGAVPPRAARAAHAARSSSPFGHSGASQGATGGGAAPEEGGSECPSPRELPAAAAAAGGMGVAANRAGSMGPATTSSSGGGGGVSKPVSVRHMVLAKWVQQVQQGQGQEQRQQQQQQQEQQLLPPPHSEQATGGWDKKRSPAECQAAEDGQLLQRESSCEIERLPTFGWEAKMEVHRSPPRSPAAASPAFSFGRAPPAAAAAAPGGAAAAAHGRHLQDEACSSGGSRALGSARQSPQPGAAGAAAAAAAGSSDQLAAGSLAASPARSPSHSPRARAQQHVAVMELHHSRSPSPQALSPHHQQQQQQQQQQGSDAQRKRPSPEAAAPLAPGGPFASLQPSSPSAFKRLKQQQQPQPQLPQQQHQHQQPQQQHQPVSRLAGSGAAPAPAARASPPGSRGSSPALSAAAAQMRQQIVRPKASRPGPGAGLVPPLQGPHSPFHSGEDALLAARLAQQAQHAQQGQQQQQRAIPHEWQAAFQGQQGQQGLRQAQGQAQNQGVLRPQPQLAQPAAAAALAAAAPPAAASERASHLQRMLLRVESSSSRHGSASAAAAALAPIDSAPANGAAAVLSQQAQQMHLAQQAQQAQQHELKDAMRQVSAGLEVEVPPAVALYCLQKYAAKLGYSLQDTRLQRLDSRGSRNDRERAAAADFALAAAERGPAASGGSTGRLQG